MKVVSTDALTKLIQLIKGTYIANTDTVVTTEVTLATVATTGAYSDLNGAPTVNNPTITITQGGTTKGSFTLNQATNDTIALDAGGSSYTEGDGIIIDNNEISVDAESIQEIDVEQINEVSVDTVITQNSSNLITSGAVYSVVGDIETLLQGLR